MKFENAPMEPERWDDVVELFYAARERTGAERLALLDSHCRGNYSLRVVVDQMLRDDEASCTFLNRPATDAFPAAASTRVPVVPTARFGRYEIVGPIGRGGMGEVWSARDTELGRLVALKFLSPDTAFGEGEHLTREARAASALNHPNIVTVHEVIRHEGTPIMVMELVEGEALRSLCESPQPLDRVIQLGQQIARALAAAHSAGLTHRDIKPENILVRKDGYVKVVDFGLARRVAGETVTMNSELMAGTPRYMSPEQARGESISPASDVFSFGLVLYELLTGQHAFPGESPMHTVKAILNLQPRAPSSLNPLVPVGLDSLILTMLVSEPTARPCAEDVARVLRDAERLSVDALLTSRKIQPRMRDQASTHRYPGRLGKWISASVLLVGVGLGLRYWRNPLTSGGGVLFRRVMDRLTEPSAPVRVVPFTSLEGSEIHPAFSPDSGQLTFAWNGPGEDNFDIYTKPLGPGPLRRLTNDKAAEYSPAWSRDGQRIAFVRAVSPGRIDVMIMPSGGGAQQKIAQVMLAGFENTPDLCDQCLLAWSPDGKDVVIPEQSGPSTRLQRISVHTGEKRALTSPPPSIRDGAPAFSPDGALLAFLRGWDPGEIDVMRTDGSQHRRILKATGQLTGLAWSPNGRYLLYTAATGGVWRVSVTGGEPERLVAADDHVIGLSAAPTGTRLVYVVSRKNPNIWRVALNSHREPATRVIASSRFDAEPRYSPDGSSVAFSSDRFGESGIWVCGRDGSNPVSVTSLTGAFMGSPEWSPDGRRIAFDGRVAGNIDIYSVNAAGGPLSRLTTDPSEEILPSWSRDGKWIYFASDRTGQTQLWKIPAEGGTARQVTRNGGFECAESLDGQYLYYTKPNIAGMWRMPAAGGEEEFVPQLRALEKFRYWEVRRRGVYFVVARPQPLLKLFDFGSARVIAKRQMPGRPIDSLRGLSVSPDETEVLYTKYDAMVSQILLAENIMLGGK